MAEKKSLEAGMEEYKFQEDDDVPMTNESEQEVPVTTKAQEAPSFLRGKRLFMPIVIVVVIILIYQFMNLYYNKKGKSSDEQEAVVAQKSVAALQQQRPQPQAAASTQVKAVQPPLIAVKRDEQPSANDISLQQKLDILATRADNNSMQIDKIREEMVRNQAILMRLNQSTDSLSRSVQDLSGSVQKLTEPKKEVKKVVKRSKKIEPPKLSYSVKAIVPGLVWLESSTGYTVVLRVGDALAGYGTISMISPKQGMVITSTGSVFQYGSNDF